jgi:hypothetical protein
MCGMKRTVWLTLLIAGILYNVVELVAPSGRAQAYKPACCTTSVDCGGGTVCKCTSANCGPVDSCTCSAQ